MKVLILNQAFYPNVVSTAQHASDLAGALAAAGHDVTVIASRRAYDEPTRLFPLAESWRGVCILRVRSTGFGKQARWRRALDFTTFLAACALRLAALARHDAVIAMTSPPLISFLAAWFVRLKGGRLVSWIMDLNPDEAIAAGWLDPRSLTARVLSRALRFSLASSDTIVVLDRFMRERIASKGISESRVCVLPPWTHDSTVSYDRDGRERFRAAHGLTKKFVVMYSGNHSPCHPLDTLLAAARHLACRPDIVFCFVGGGSEFHKVREYSTRHAPGNIVCLPYQPFGTLSASLSAADLHLVVMGDPFVGILHPCKIYNVLSLGIPFLYIGPQPSHITEAIPAESRSRFAFFVRHGDVEGVIAHILSAAAANAGRSAALQAAAKRFSEHAIVPSLISVIEAAGSGAQPAAVLAANSLETHAR